MQTTEIVLVIGLILQFVAFAVVMIGVFRRIATKADIGQLEDRFDAQDEKIEDLRRETKADFQRVVERFDAQDEKIENLRRETKADFQRVDERFDAQDEKIENLRRETKADFQRVDDRFEAQRIEFKADLQRVEDRAAEANVFHARSVELLDAIRRELEDRRERL